MSCLGQCGDCTCDRLDVCLDTTKRNDRLDSKLKVLKDYACLLAQTTCVKLPQRIGQYAYYLWCYQRDILTMVRNLDNRVADLCSVVKCQDKRITQIIDYLNAQLQDDVAFGMRSAGSIGAEGDNSTYTAITTTKDGKFTIAWNMTVDRVEIGVGKVYGQVNHSYVQNKDGSITATIKGFTLDRATYTITGANNPVPDPASFSVMDNNGTTIWKRDYSPSSSWTETINKTVTLNRTVTLQPKGGTSGDIPILRTLDDWTANDTVGHISANYTNNNVGVVFVSDGCPAKCTACEHKED